MFHTELEIIYLKEALVLHIYYLKRSSLPKLYPFSIQRVFSVIIFCAVTVFTRSYSQAPVLSFNPVIPSGLTSPVDVVNAGDGTNRLFIVQQGGIIRYYREGVLGPNNFLDISGIISTGSERGLLSMAFHPGFRTNGFFFVYYINLLGDLTLARYRVNSSNPDVADASTGQVLLTIFHREFANHNGAKLNFGADGYLYFATGDGGGGGDPHFNSQKGNVLLGKMLRINVNDFSINTYTVPPDNPFIADPAVADEIWASGLRNPFRWSFDRLTHDMWIGDVGQIAREEVNFVRADSTKGINYGWRCYEGNSVYRDSGCSPINNYLFPVFDYGRTNQTGGRSVTGGYVYRGSAYPALYGWYTCIDFLSANGWLIRPGGSGGWIVQMQSGLPGNIAGFGEDENGELYAVSTRGILYRVQASASGALPVLLQSFNVVEKNGRHEISWTTTAEQNVRQFEIQLSSEGTNFRTVGVVAATNTNMLKSYRFDYAGSTGDKAFYRLKIVDINNTFVHSDIVALEGVNEGAVLVAPTIVTNERVMIRLNKAFRMVQLSDLSGRIVRTKFLSTNTGIVYLDVADLKKGMYILKFTGTGTEVHKKIFVQ